MHHVATHPVEVGSCAGFDHGQHPGERERRRGRQGEQRDPLDQGGQAAMAVQHRADGECQDRDDGELRQHESDERLAEPTRPMGGGRQC